MLKGMMRHINIDQERIGGRVMMGLRRENSLRKPVTVTFLVLASKAAFRYGCNSKNEMARACDC